MIALIKDKFEDTKAGIRIRKSKKDRQNMAKKKKDKRTNNYLQIKRMVFLDNVP